MSGIWDASGWWGQIATADVAAEIAVFADIDATETSMLHSVTLQ